MKQTFADAVVLVTIQNESADYDAFGTGFVIDIDARSAYVLTCAHVLEELPRSSQVYVDEHPATLVVSGHDRGIDLAVLRVDGSTDKMPIPLANNGEPEKLFRILGYYDYDDDRKIARRELKGRIGKSFEVNADGNRELIRAWDLKIEDSDILQQGYSGSPVIDARTGYALGVVSHRLQQGEKGHAISIDGLLQIWPKRANELIKKPVDGKSFSKLGEVGLFFSRPPRFCEGLLWPILIVGLSVSMATECLRFLGLFESAELAAYDHVLTARLPEKPSDRIVVVEATRNDVDAQESENEPYTLTEHISDPALLETVDDLNTYGAKVIGIDLYLPPEDSAWSEARKEQFRSIPELYAVCAQPHVEGDAIAAPSSKAIARDKVGFSNFVRDSDFKLRRQLVKYALTDKQAGSACQSELSLNTLMALAYLALDASEPKPLNYPDLLTPPPESNLKIQNTLIKRINTYKYGGYHDLDAGGFHLLLNYREPEGNDLRMSFPHFSMQQIREGGIDPKVFEDKIVLVGLTAESYADDDFVTPYGRVLGVTLQAHMIDQIVSAVLDGRSMIWVWPSWGEFVWILGWSLLGGALVRFYKRPVLFLGLLSVGLVGIYVSCVIVMMRFSGWIPLVPPAFSFVLANGVMVYASSRKVRSLT